MAFSRITGLAINMAPGSIFSARLKKKDTDTANTHGSGNARLTPGAGTGSGTPLAATWVYDPGAVGGGYTHYADIALPDGYFNGRPWTVEARDTSSDSYETYTGISFEPDAPDVTLYASSGSVPAAPVLSVSSKTGSSIGLSWPSVAGASSYKAFISSNNEDFLPVGGTITGTGFVASGLSAGTRYWLYLKAANGTGDSAASNTVTEVTTSAGGGTETPVPVVVRDNSANELYRHASKYTVNTLPFAVVKMEVGSEVRSASADASGVCTLILAAKISTDVATVRFRAEVGNIASAWTSAITVVDGPNSIPWVAVLETDDDTYEAWKATFTGDPDSLPAVNRVLKISPSPRTTQAAARLDAQNYLNSL